ncbi:MAG TPA: TetR family transcriptional regulator [Pyrinomonadaceae bacterium]|jgi:AcrR family transcriptional regulator|nr:TetR family transcriptional regulator [Pyrinomonadaceae bacterium]
MPRSKSSTTKHIRSVSGVQTRSAKRSRPAARKTAPRKAGIRAASKEAIRDKIVKAALGLFQTKGFDATTTKAIARKASIAEGTVFNYFKSKDDIALHFFEAEVDSAMAAVRDNPRLKKAPLEEKLFALVHAQLEYLEPYENFIGAAMIHALKPSSPLGPFSHRAMELRHRYLRFVEELIEESIPKKQNALGFLAPEVFWIYYMGALLYWLYDTSEGKQHTLAFLDRSLSMGAAMLRQGGRYGR